MFYNNGSIRRTLPNPIAHGGIIFDPTPEQYRAAGWRELVADPTPVPEGQRVTSRTYTVDATHAYESLHFEPIPEPPNPLAPYASEIAAFQSLWAGAGLGAVPESWLDAFDMLESAGVDQATINKLLALRVALSPVWDLILEAQ